MSRSPAHDLPPAMAAAIAAHRFGLGEPSLQGIGADAPGWLLAQVGPAEPQRGTNLPQGLEGLRRFADVVRRLKQPPAGAGPAAMAAPGLNAAGMTPADAAALTPNAEAQVARSFRALVQGDVRARLSTAALSQHPFNERLALFWANHFTVSSAKGSARGVVGSYEREAIRPHIAGNFETLLRAAVLHGGMLRYLDNDSSAGPDSALVRRLARRPRAAGDAPPRITGLNENLAREVLELHTLGVAGGGTAYGGWGGYTQADVTAFAAVLTGWRVPLRDLAPGATSEPGAPTSRFDANWHQPGPKTVLGKRYEAGPAALDALLHDLAVHPSTARFIATKLARHFVADDPPPALVATLEADFRRSGGDLPSLYRTLVLAPDAWAPQPAKLKTPEEFVISSARLLQLGDKAFARVADGGVSQLGQNLQAAPSPAGWPDRAEEWLGPDAVWKRVEWATRVAGLVGRQVDARALASASLGPLLQESSRRQIDRAADGPQALALLLLAPEFQRR
jgi:uncharacterized protein (DUF1800 family)